MTKSKANGGIWTWKRIETSDGCLTLFPLVQNQPADTIREAFAVKSGFQNQARQL
jgi:hypothetical protein